MQSLMILHRSVMQNRAIRNDDKAREDRAHTRYPGRAAEREALKGFMDERGYHRRAMRSRLAVVKDCGSQSRE